MPPAELTQKIKDFALQSAGFDLVGVSRSVLPEKYERAVENWVEKGYAGGMDYMVRDGGKRAHPERSLPTAVSVISLAANYYHPEDPKPEGVAGKVAKYAYGRDYHKVLEKKLKSLGRFILEAGGEGTEVKSYVDTGPILEKPFTQQAGLGFFGKNTNIITKQYGSWVFLANLITNLELVYDEPHTGSCGSCRICIDACPTGALLGDYALDATRCISYLTIESKAPTPEGLKPHVGEWLFGCDVCQDVCPYNYRMQVTRHTDFYPDKKAGSWVEVAEIEALQDDDAFRKRFEGSPLKRPKLQGLLRNAAIVKRNHNDAV